MRKNTIRITRLLLKPIEPIKLHTQGVIQTTYETLIKKLGVPHMMSGNPYRAAWWYQLENGTPFSVYILENEIPFYLFNWLIKANSFAEYNDVRIHLGFEPVRFGPEISHKSKKTMKLEELRGTL